MFWHLELAAFTLTSFLLSRVFLVKLELLALWVPG